MRRDILCMNSDAVNRYHFQMPVGVLEKSLKDLYRNGLPYIIGHNVHLSIGWIRPFGLFIEPGLARMIAAREIADNAADQNAIYKGMSRYMALRYRDAFLPVSEEFMPLVKDHVTDAYNIIETGCVAVSDEAIAIKMFPFLFEACDDDGLVPITLLFETFIYSGQGIFKHRFSNLCIFAHQYFRRSQSRNNNFHFYFLDALMNTAGRPNVRVNLRLDTSMVGYAPSIHEVGELAYHYGPPYTDDISVIKHGITRLVSNESQRLFTGVSATEFYWKTEVAQNTFELEELQDNPGPGSGDRYHCRYSHAIFSKEAGHFYHFDGAIRSYDLEKMLERISMKFTEFGRKADYTKLFRLDGKITIADWKLLVTHYLQDNPLIYEYYGLSEEGKQFDPQPRAITKLQETCPFVITKEEGVKVLLSYHLLPDKIREGRYIDIYDERFDEGVAPTKDCVEWGVLELQKSIVRVGG